MDPATGELKPLFSPRQERWHEHFSWQGEVLLGTTAVGRVTVEALALNRPLIRAIRAEEAAVGRHPPEDWP
jgi:hypothetical protein